jgi:hypothetical protein
MANNYTSGIWLIDTPSSTPIVQPTALVAIRSMKWISVAGVLGDLATITDGAGSPVWQGVCSGPDFDTGIFDLGGTRTIRGLTVPTLGSGKIYIYTDAR